MGKLQNIGSFESDGIKYDVRGDGIYKLDTNLKKYIKLQDDEITEAISFNANLEREKYNREKIVRQLAKWTDEILDEQAQALRYDDMKSAKSYTGYPNIYQKECVELAKWASSCWFVLEKIEPKVINGDLIIKSKEDLKAQLPKYVGE